MVSTPVRGAGRAIGGSRSRVYGLPGTTMRVIIAAEIRVRPPGATRRSLTEVIGQRVETEDMRGEHLALVEQHLLAGAKRMFMNPSTPTGQITAIHGAEQMSPLHLRELTNRVYTMREGDHLKKEALMRSEKIWDFKSMNLFQGDTLNSLKIVTTLLEKCIVVSRLLKEICLAMKVKYSSILAKWGLVWTVKLDQFSRMLTERVLGKKDVKLNLIIKNKNMPQMEVVLVVLLSYNACIPSWTGTKKL